MNQEEYYYSFNKYLRARFKERVQRISLNAGFSCPNRDGSLDSEGCIYCDERGFANFPDTALSVEAQIRQSLEFCRSRFKAEKFIAYFQNASNTYAQPEVLKKTYDTIKRFPEIVGLFISTRPDCVDAEILELIAAYQADYEVWIEYGLQSSHDQTLRWINRGHDFSCFKTAVTQTAAKGIKVAAHVILGLPGESRSQVIETAQALNALPISGVKIHVLHVIKDTKLDSLYAQGKISLLSEPEYIGLVCDFLEVLRPDCVVMRLVSNARPEVLVAPQWINNKQKVLFGIEQEFSHRKTCQGAAFKE